MYDINQERLAAQTAEYGNPLTTPAKEMLVLTNTPPGKIARKKEKKPRNQWKVVAGKKALGRKAQTVEKTTLIEAVRKMEKR